MTAIHTTPTLELYTPPLHWSESKMIVAQKLASWTYSMYTSDNTHCTVAKSYGKVHTHTHTHSEFFI